MTKLITIAKHGEPTLQVHPEALDQHEKLGWKVSAEAAKEDGNEENTGGNTIIASDAAKKLAEEHELDLSTVKGTGANGSITKGDVQKALDDAEAEKKDGKEAE